MTRQSLCRAYNRWAMSLTLSLVLGFPVVPFMPLPMISEAEAAPARRAARPAARPAARTAHRTTRRHHRHHRAVRGTVVVSLPPGCSTVRTRRVNYYHCDGVYYTQQYQGTSLVYVVVDAP